MLTPQQQAAQTQAQSDIAALQKQMTAGGRASQTFTQPPGLIPQKPVQNTLAPTLPGGPQTTLPNTAPAQAGSQKKKQANTGQPSKAQQAAPPASPAPAPSTVSPQASPAPQVSIDKRTPQGSSSPPNTGTMGDLSLAQKQQLLQGIAQGDPAAQKLWEALQARQPYNAGIGGALGPGGGLAPQPQPTPGPGNAPGVGGANTGRPGTAPKGGGQTPNTGTMADLSLAQKADLLQKIGQRDPVAIKLWEALQARQPYNPGPAAPPVYPVVPDDPIIERPFVNDPYARFQDRMAARDARGQQRRAWFDSLRQSRGIL